MNKLVLASIVFAMACAQPGPRTEVMLEINAGPAVAAASGQLIVDIFGGELGTDPSGYELRRTLRLHEGPAPVAWPRRIALIPLDEQSMRGYRATIEAQNDAGELVARTEIVGSYAAEHTVLLAIELSDDCMGVLCDPIAPRCTAGACTDPYVDAESLPELLEE